MKCWERKPTLEGSSNAGLIHPRQCPASGQVIKPSETRPERSPIPGGERKKDHRKSKRLAESWCKSLPASTKGKTR
ncbi:hypothetical protein TNIN_27611 [Trichonephila inaurata madagascariensis]|uniref:Uncharacterized protein n=1 Tax=Trichonephila inaurata madagascariensis TaxID=2747483 RepID=A0A8X7CNW6_9ARAC|nr:hypothetical protein TNIN_27611 [Trichonephila inaurata madagascariensis]